MSGEFCIKRDDCETNDIKSVSRMRLDEETCNVTLAGNDGKHVLGHKKVLISNSEYIRDSIGEKNLPFPLISFPFLDSKDLNRLLDFMYHGKVIVNLEEMEKFIELSKKLRIRGMTDDRYSVCFVQESVNEADKSQSKEQTIGEKYYSNLYEDEVGKTMTLERVQEPLFGASYGKPLPLIRYRNVMLSKHNFHIEAMKFATSIGLGQYKCNYCAHKAKSGHMKEHVERHMVGLVVQCTLCHGCYGGLGQYRKHFHTGKCRELTQRRDEANNSQSKEQTIGEKYFNNVCEEEVSTTVSLKEDHQPIFKASYDKPQPLIRYKNVILTKQDFILEAMTFFTTIGFTHVRRTKMMFFELVIR